MARSGRSLVCLTGMHSAFFCDGNPASVAALPNAIHTQLNGILWHEETDEEDVRELGLPPEIVADEKELHVTDEPFPPFHCVIDVLIFPPDGTTTSPIHLLIPEVLHWDTLHGWDKPRPVVQPGE